MVKIVDNAPLNIVLQPLRLQFMIHDKKKPINPYELHQKGSLLLLPSHVVDGIGDLNSQR